MVNKSIMRTTPDRAVKQKSWYPYQNVICFALLVAYMSFVPGGTVGLAISLSCLAIKLAMTQNMLTLGVYFLLFGIKTMGLVTLVFGAPGIGGKIASGVGILILFFCLDIRKTFLKLQKPFWYLIWIVLVLFLSYLLGPQTEYAIGKLVGVIVTGSISILTYYLLISSSAVDWKHLGQLGVLSALVCLAAVIMVEPTIKPDGIFDFGAMRIAKMLDKDIFDIRNFLGSLSLLGFTLNYAASPDYPLSRSTLVQTLIYTVTAIIIILWGGARLPIATVVITLVAMTLVKPRYRVRYRISSMLMVGLVAGMVMYGFYKDVQFVTSVADESRSFGSRVNRDTNWEAGYRRISEKPLFGHGLGGYYIEGYSAPGEGTYAHNMIVELLSETGLVGTFLVLTPLFWWGRRIVKSSLLKKRAHNGGAVFPLLLILFLQGMISFDLSVNIEFLVFAAIVLLGRTRFKQPLTAPI